LVWLLVFFVATSSSLIRDPGEASNRVKCEKVKQRHWGWVISGFIKTCFMDDVTRISSAGFSIDSVQDQTVYGMIFEHNLEINYLPDNIHENFPNLTGLSAYDAGLKGISRTNFINMIYLKELHLSNNYLGKIYKDTFKDLVSLEVVFLGK
jgi:Leucine rich repeat